MHKTMPQYLYHGTSRKNYEQMQKVGALLPRGRHGTSNWKVTIESNPDTIYLTTAYPLHFCVNSMDLGREEAVILEIDTSLLPPDGFVADEDAIEQYQRTRDKLPKKWSMVQRTRWYRERVRNYNPLASLELLGTCGYMGAIPVNYIHRAVFLPSESVMHLVMGCGMDPTVSLLHYRLFGEACENNVRWIFGDTEHIPLTPRENHQPPPRPDMRLERYQPGLLHPHATAFPMY